MTTLEKLQAIKARLGADSKSEIVDEVYRLVFKDDLQAIEAEKEGLRMEISELQNKLSKLGG